MHELVKAIEKVFSYSDYIATLASKGDATKRVVEAFAQAVSEDRIVIHPRSAAVISTVAVQGNKANIFLPVDYDERKALFEAPRILFDSLKAIKSPLVDSEELENSVREELSK